MVERLIQDTNNCRGAITIRQMGEERFGHLMAIYDSHIQQMINTKLEMDTLLPTVAVFLNNMNGEQAMHVIHLSSLTIDAMSEHIVTIEEEVAKFEGEAIFVSGHGDFTVRKSGGDVIIEGIKTVIFTPCGIIDLVRSYNDQDDSLDDPLLLMGSTDLDMAFDHIFQEHKCVV